MNPHVGPTAVGSAKPKKLQIPGYILDNRAIYIVNYYAHTWSTDSIISHYPTYIYLSYHSPTQISAIPQAPDILPATRIMGLEVAFGIVLLPLGSPHPRGTALHRGDVGCPHQHLNSLGGWLIQNPRVSSYLGRGFGAKLRKAGTIHCMLFFCLPTLGPKLKAS